MFFFLSLALEESCDLSDTAQFLIFVYGLREEFKITEKLAAIKRTTRGEWFIHIGKFMLGKAWFEMVQTSRCCYRWLCKSDTFLKQKQDKVTAVKLVCLHYIIYQEVLCKSLLKINHIFDVVTKIFKYIRARAQIHRLPISHFYYLIYI